VSEQKRTTSEEARRVGDAIGVDWQRFDLEQFRAGIDVEFEHGAHDPQTNVTDDDPIITGKIACAHMKEFPDYYDRLERMEGRPNASGPNACPRCDPALRNVGVCGPEGASTDVAGRSARRRGRGAPFLVATPGG